nr:Krueppel-like factor 8 [Dermacentor andersoni]
MVLFGANATGEDKLPLLIPGKAEKLRCFRNAMIPMECIYRSNKRFDAKNRQMVFIIDICLSDGKIDNLKAVAVEFLPAHTAAVLQPMDQGIIETTWKPNRKALLQRMLRAYETSKRSPTALRTPAFPTPLSVTLTMTNLMMTRLEQYNAVPEIAGLKVEGDFETFVLADTASPVVTPAMYAEIRIDTVGGPDKDEEPVEEEPCEVPTMVQTREYLCLLQNKVECMGGLVQCLVKSEQESLMPDWPPASTQMLRRSLGNGAELPAGASRYQCRLCPYASKWRSSLVLHERVHTGERPFRCHQCSRAFAGRTDMVRHLRTHTGERPFQCPLCPATFTQRGNARAHHLRLHGRSTPVARRDRLAHSAFDRMKH